MKVPPSVLLNFPPPIGYNLNMASNVYIQHFADGTSCLVKRSTPQGRKPQGLVRWNGRIDKDVMDAISAHVAPLRPYYTVNDIIRIALRKYVCTELVNT